MKEIQRLVAEMERHSDFGCAIGLGFAGGVPSFTHFSYSQEFLTAYQDGNYALEDATLSWGMKTTGVATWSEIEKVTGKSGAFNLARSFGIESGVCFSAVVNGQSSIASLSLRSGANIHAQTLISILSLLSAAAMEIPCSEPRTSIYNYKTMEYIKLAAAGLKDADIAEQLGLTIHGARNRRKKALAEIGANTTAQAIYMIATQGIQATNYAELH
jgi:DNA-binding CsgD family transcriptional regulator